METVYTEAEWVRHMQRNGKRIFLHWVKREAKIWCKFIITMMIIVMFISVAGYMADMIVR